MTRLDAKPVIIGKHLYMRCEYCGKFVRLTGWFARWHLCLLPEEIAAIHAKRTREAR